MNLPRTQEKLFKSDMKFRNRFPLVCHTYAHEKRKVFYKQT